MAIAPSNTKISFKNPQTIDQCWINSRFSPMLDNYGESYPLYVDRFIISACSAVNRMCNRYFNKQQADEIFTNESLQAYFYTQITLKNKPIISVDKAWLNITGTFNEINLQYLMQATDQGTIKLLPDVAISSSIVTNQLYIGKTTDLWVKYTSGYVTDQADVDSNNQLIPADVALATAIIAEVMLERAMSTSTGGKSFKTQTYSETSFGFEEDPKFKQAKEMLKPYKLVRFVS